MTETRESSLKPSFHAVAIYDLFGRKERPKLADYRGVLATMHGGGDGTFLLSKITDWLEPDTWPEDAPKVLALMDGSHPSSFRLSIVKAAGENGQDITMPLIEDPITHRSLAIGPAPLQKDLAHQLKNEGITYISARDEDAKAGITTFLVSDVQERVGMQIDGTAPIYFKDRDSVKNFVQDLVMASLSVADFARTQVALENPNVADLLLPISQGVAEATLYTAAAA